MNARILFILLVISVLLAFTRRFRKVGLSLAVVLVVLLLWFSINVTQINQSPNTSPASSSSSALIAKPLAQLLTMQLDGDGAPWHLKGSVQNVGTVPIRSVNLNIERFDCPTREAAQVDCVLLWQGSRVVRISIPATGSAKLDESFYSHDAVPRLKGIARNRITILDVQ